MKKLTFAGNLLVIHTEIIPLSFIDCKRKKYGFFFSFLSSSTKPAEIFRYMCVIISENARAEAEQWQEKS